MVFSSTLFLFLFLPITLLMHYVMQEEYRNYWLLMASLIFFAWSQPSYLWILLLNVAINYTGALMIAYIKKFRKLFLGIAAGANLALLFYFKYFNFVLTTISKLIRFNCDVKNIVLPIGISFFTFQGMSYVIDVYRRDVPVQKNIIKLALYITLFPQLVAGPIVRYTDIAAEIDKRNIVLHDFVYGIERFIIGLSKKALIANALAETVDSIWAEHVGGGNLCIVAWLGSIAYTLQIYFDFSGYSDMAIGLGRMFGFHFQENFSLPYISTSISEFWRRWHISLSSWFRDYVYIPLGGNRKNVYLNLAVVFLLTGIWHGASWNFIVWGIWNGIFIIAERLLRNRNKKSRYIGYPFATCFSKIYTLSVVNIGWVLFRAPSLVIGIRYLGTMFGIIIPKNTGFTIFRYVDRWTVAMIFIAILFASSIPGKMINNINKYINEIVKIVIKYVILLILLYLSMIRIVSGTYNPFIYFQF